MIIGEAPGKTEDQLGRPFVGASGMILQQALIEANALLPHLYVTNVVKHRPPNNRTPEQAEIDACLPWLKNEIELVRPLVILCLGKTATNTLAQISGHYHIPRTNQRGYKWTWWKTGKIQIHSTYHPAYVMYQRHQPEIKTQFNEDVAYAYEYAMGRA